MIDANQVNEPDLRHTGWIRAVAAGRWAERPVFASAGNDRRVLLWDAATGQPLGPALTELAAAVSHVVFAGPERDVLLTGDTGGVVLRWDIRDGAPHGEPFQQVGSGLMGLGSTVVDGRAVVGVGTGDGLRIFDLATGALHAELRVGEGKQVHVTDIGVLDGRLVALTIAHTIAESSPYLAELTLWEVAAGTALREPWLVPEEVEDFGSLALLDGQLVAIRGHDCSDYFEEADEDGDEDEEEDDGWDDSPYQSEYFLEQVHDVELGIVADGGRRYVMEHLPDQPRAGTVAPSPHGDVLLFAIHDRVAVVNMRGTPKPGDIEDFFYTGHDAFVSDVAATEVDGRTVIASGDGKGNVRFWGLDTPDRHSKLG